MVSHHGSIEIKEERTFKQQIIKIFQARFDLSLFMGSNGNKGVDQYSAAYKRRSRMACLRLKMIVLHTRAFGLICVVRFL